MQRGHSPMALAHAAPLLPFFLFPRSRCRGWRLGRGPVIKARGLVASRPAVADRWLGGIGCCCEWGALCVAAGRVRASRSELEAPSHHQQQRRASGRGGLPVVAGQRLWEGIESIGLVSGMWSGWMAGGRRVGYRVAGWLAEQQASSMLAWGGRNDERAAAQAGLGGLWGAEEQHLSRDWSCWHRDKSVDLSVDRLAGWPTDGRRRAAGSSGQTRRRSMAG